MLRRIQLAQAARMAATLSAMPRPTATSLSSSLSCSSPSSMVMTCVPLQVSRRTFLDSVFGKGQPKVKVDDVAFDKEQTRYHGTLFGLPADNVVYYAKIGGGVFIILLSVYIFFKGYVLLSRFSLQTVARLGFMGGFFTCLICYTTALAMTRRYRINANTVYNQSIAMVMHNAKVQQHLGTHPRTGEFRTYNNSGGFKLPLMRRIRSGSYELSDLLGLKQRRLQMMFTLKNPASGSEGLVSCDVRKETTGFMSSTNVYKSLSVTLYDSSKKSEPETIILVGKPEDVVYRSLILR